MFDWPAGLGGSGIFVCDQLFSRPVQITSPYLKPSSLLNPADGETGPAADSFVQRNRHEPGVFPISKPLVTNFSERLIEIARIVKESSYSTVLCPMRGARLAGLQTDLICESESIQAFDGTGMAQKVNDDRILGELRPLIFGFPLTGERRTIGVLDTAKGGDSCREMSRILRILRDETKEHWSVCFHLIHAEGNRPPRANEARQFARNNFQVDIRFHPVASLLIEDEPKLLGYDIDRAGGRSQIIKFQTEGQILYFGPSEATLFKPAPLDESMIALVSREISNLIQQMPDIRAVNLDYWPYDA